MKAKRCLKSFDTKKIMERAKWFQRELLMQIINESVGDRGMTIGDKDVVNINKKENQQGALVKNEQGCVNLRVPKTKLKKIIP